MLKLSLTTTAAIALHAANQSWVVFAQVHTPSDPRGPIKIEGARAAQLLPCMRSLVVNCPFDVFLIGLIPSPVPAELAAQLHTEFDEAMIHDGWFEPVDQLTTLIEQNGTAALQDLLAVTHPAGIEDDSIMSIDDLATALNVSVVTIRRWVKAEQIPYLRHGRILRFVYSDVLATLQRR